jgi:uncharacterized protein (TIGR00299 family) protein
LSKTAYFDLFSGCSGDMILGALLDAGLPVDQLTGALANLPVAGYTITQEKVKRSSMTATLCHVAIANEAEEHHRSYSDIVSSIKSAQLSDRAKQLALSIFHDLGEAEAAIHRVPLDTVHFHEVGAIDSIVDIVGAAIGFDMLGITQFYSSPFPVAGGKVMSQHGVLPLPAPAVLEIIARKHAPTVAPPHEAMEGRELVTPTGAAIISSLAEYSRPPMNLEKIGYGAGSRNPAEYPNVMRLWIGDMPEGERHGEMVLLETNIDDMNPQVYGYVMEKLFAQGALDVWFTPIQMKKNRPAIMFSVLAPADSESLIAETLMKETTTLGIRVRYVHRHIAAREILEINSTYGKVKVKIKRIGGEAVSVAPEYDDCSRIARETGLPLREVLSKIEIEARKLIG